MPHPAAAAVLFVHPLCMASITKPLVLRRSGMWFLDDGERARPWRGSLASP
jgi:hypothetical protein